MFVNHAIIFGCPLIHWVVDPEDEYAEFECDVTEQYGTPVKSELRYPITQAIRSQWESQDLPTLGNQYHVTDDTASQEQGYNTCAPNQG